MWNWNLCALIKTLYSWSYLFDFHPKITSGQECAGTLRMNANRLSKITAFLIVSDEAQKPFLKKVFSIEF